MHKLILADTHVHLHPRFDPEYFFDAAADQFHRFGMSEGTGDPLHLLCLTDVQGLQTDEALCRYGQAGAWRFARNADEVSVCARTRDGREIQVLPGRQIVTVEDLELLALNCRLEIADGQHRLADLIGHVKEAGGTPVVPWGFGKWSGRRGEVVRELIRQRRDFVLADNGNRLRGSAEPELLREGRRQGISVLAGSDPLPFWSQARRAGSYGVRAVVGHPADEPSAIFRALVDRAEWTVYGELASPIEFAVSQLKMQLKKRFSINL